MPSKWLEFANSHTQFSTPTPAVARVRDLLNLCLTLQKSKTLEKKNDPFFIKALHTGFKMLHDALYEEILARHTGLELSMSEEEFKVLEPTRERIMYFHGNQDLTSAPFFLGGVPDYVFFQWGNLLGVAKYTAAPGERIVEGNILVYFADKQEKTLEQFIQDYQNKQDQLIHSLPAPKLIAAKPVAAPPPDITPSPTITAPTLSLRPTPFSIWKAR